MYLIFLECVEDFFLEKLARGEEESTSINFMITLVKFKIFTTNTISTDTI